MAASVVGIWNRCLQKLGQTLVTSTDENTRNARACNAAYEPCRDALFEKHTWRFTILRAALAAESPAPTWGKANSYAVPSDFIRLAPDYPEDLRHKDWEIENGKIVTDETAPLYIRYVSKVTDPNVMTPLFRELLATKMAFELCEVITQSNTKKRELREDMRELLQEARRANAFLSIPAVPPDDEWLEAWD